jgi:hypothetical protein
MNNIKVKSVKFSGSATIVFFDDGTKAVTKCRAGDEYDINLGVSWAICKKVARDRGLTVRDLITAVVPQESYRTMPTFTTRVSVRTIAQLFCDTRIDFLVDAGIEESHDAAESVAFKQAFDESLWPEKAYAGKRPGPGNSRYKPLIDAFIDSGLSVIKHKYTTSSTDYRVGRKASNNVQSCIESYIRTNRLSDIIRVYRDNGYVCIARINK